jgi:hypothetical protein
MATKKIVEKKTGEKYASKAAMMKHEKGESKAEMKKEYGKVKSPIKQVAPKAKPMVKKAASPVAMKKVSAKTAYNIKEASNQKLTAGARKHYAENAQAAMKNKPVAKMKKC